MKPRRGRTKRQVRAIRLWTYAEAARALPYVRSLTNSLRDAWLDLQREQLAAKRLHDLRKPSRSERIALEERLKDAGASEDEFDVLLAELMHLDIFLLDPVQGLALIPFQEGEELAWYVFDLFDAEGLTSWRYHKDPLETRRPVVQNRKDEGPLLVADGSAN